MQLLQNDWAEETWPKYDNKELQYYIQSDQERILYINIWVAQFQLWYSDPG